MGISCGNPVPHCGLKEGATYVDLGCGTGTDVFLAARITGATGKSIGLDYVAEMCARAEECGKKVVPALPAGSYEFDHADCNGGYLKKYADASIDAVSGNCCIHFLDRKTVVPEILRILKPGGKFVFAEVCRKQCLPPDDLYKLMNEAFEKDIVCTANTVGGKMFRSFVSISQTYAMDAQIVMDEMKALGFVDVDFVQRLPVPGTVEFPNQECPPFINSKTGESNPEVEEWVSRFKSVFEKYNVNDYVSFDCCSGTKPAQ